MLKHKKHTHLTKKHNDTYAPNEIAIIGTHCKLISQLVHQISAQLSSNYKLAYLDASHAKNSTKNRLSKFTYHYQGHLEISTLEHLNPYQQRIYFAQFDYVFINGNHYKGAKQILILDTNKEASVLKKLDQLDNIQFIIKLDANTEYFNFLVEKYPDIKNITCYTIHQKEQIATHVKQLIKSHIAPVKGLVLVGGKSTRMGVDKSELIYYEKPQKEVAKNLLDEYLTETFYSVQNNAKNQNEIYDVFLNLGAFGGICSAFQKDPNAAWFVLATDLPFLNKKLIKQLLEQRNVSKIATTVQGKSNPFPEPLITIYEPKAYPILLQYLAQGYSCPRKMLINNDVEIIEVPDALIRNVNTPKEFEAAKKEIVYDEIKDNTK